MAIQKHNTYYDTTKPNSGIYCYDDSEPEPTEFVNALARENNDIIIFNDNIALRV